MKEFILGILFAIPIFSFLLLIFRDLLIKHFLKNAIFTRPMQEEREISQEVLEHNLLESYRAMLILHHQFFYLANIDSRARIPLDICKMKLKEVDMAIKSMEDLFKNENIDYTAVKDEIDKAGNIFDV